MKILQLHTGNSDFDASGTRGIGGSSVASIFNVGRKSRYTLWSELAGLTVDTFEGNEATSIGHDLELPALGRYARQFNKAVCIPRATLVHDEHDWMLGNVDAFEVAPDELHPAGTVTFTTRLNFAPLAIIEVKTAGIAGYGDTREWEDDGVPRGYLYQGLHYSALCEVERVVFIGYIAGLGFIVREREFYEDDWMQLIEDESEFMELVRNKIEPDVDASDSTSATLAKRYPAPKVPSVEVDDDVVKMALAYNEVSAAISSAEKVKKGLKNQLVAAIGEAEMAMVGEAVLFTYKKQDRKGYEVTATTFRTLDVKGTK